MTVRLALPAAHLTCVSLLVVDGVARACRLQQFVESCGSPFRFRDALYANVLEDAGAAVTPMRIGGQPARFAMLARAGIPMRSAVVASVVEAALMYPLVALAAVGVAVAFAPEWWDTIGVQLGHSALGIGRWLAAGVAIGIVAWFCLRRVLPQHRHSTTRTVVHAWAEVRRIDRRTLLMASVLSLVSVAARVAILPVLVLTVPAAPPLGAVVLSSFVLLYGQIVLPMPSGAGVVEAGFLSGGAGVSGTPATHILLAWRIYTSLISIAAGLVVAAWMAATAFARRRRAARDGVTSTETSL